LIPSFFLYQTQNHNIYFVFSLFLYTFVDMKLSIVVPVYCVESTLDRCVESIVNQSFTDFELILVDDGSPDDCPAMCDRWAGNDKRIKVIHKENGGLSDARNAGIDIATGEFITFVDSDDFLEHDTYEKVLARAGTCDIVEFPVYCHFGSERQTLLTFSLHTYEDMETYWLETMAYAHTYAWNKIYRRALFREVSYPAGRVFEDAATLPALLDRARTIKTVGEGRYYYTANDKGITANADGAQLEMLLNSHLDVIGRWCDDCYYMHVLNIQIIVNQVTGHTPRLPFRRINPLTRRLTWQSRLKAVALNLIGLKGICRLNKIIHKTGRKSS